MDHSLFFCSYSSMLLWKITNYLFSKTAHPHIWFKNSPYTYFNLKCLLARLAMISQVFPLLLRQQWAFLTAAQNFTYMMCEQYWFCAEVQASMMTHPQEYCFGLTCSLVNDACWPSFKLAEELDLLKERTLCEAQL